MIRVLIVDDHAIVREGWKQILADTDDIRIAGEAGSYAEALAQMSEQRWDVGVLDISLPGRSGVELLKQSKRLYPDRPLLVLSVHSEEQYAMRVMRAGASGYLTKETAPTELIDAVRKVYRGGKFITEKLSELMLFHLDENVDEVRHDSLSDREFQVFCMLAHGKSATQIADELSLSVKTISTFRTRIMQKMDFGNTVDLIKYALKHGLAE